MSGSGWGSFLSARYVESRSVAILSYTNIYIICSDGARC